MKTSHHDHPDGDIHKGVVENDRPDNTPGQPNLENQQIHRTDNEEIKDSDSDLPEPGSSPEHSGQQK